MPRFGLLLPFVLLASVSTGAQQSTSITVDDLAGRIRTSEAAVTAKLQELKPIVEVYAQHVTPHDTLGTVPVKDDYFLGRFDWARQGPAFRPLTARSTREQMAQWLTRPPWAQVLRPEDFVVMMLPEWRAIDTANYTITFLRREFLGEVRCLVLELEPKNRDRGFTGRLWVDDRDFAIVRFNGITRGMPGASKARFNVDSWRTNVSPGLWLPSYVYAEQQSEFTRDAKLKSHVRVWGYDLKGSRPSQEFTTIEIGDPSVVDDAARPQQLSPTESQRVWEKQAEENVIDRLSKAGLLAPPGEVDKILDTVIRNLQITNELPSELPISARVLLTSPLDSLAIGRTIVLSRGLIDVLPDEASLAMVLAHELAHINLGHKIIDTKFAFADSLMVSDDELLNTVRIKNDQDEETAAAAEVIKYLEKSPYKDKLADAGLFLRAVNERASKLKKLIQPHVLAHSGGDHQERQMNALIQKAPTLEPTSVDQIAALPLGGRVVMNSWSSEVELLRGAAVPIATAREKSTLAVTPLMPFLRYIDAKTVTTQR